MSLAGNYRSDAVVVTVASPQVALIFVCATTDDGHLIKVLSAKLLHHKVSLYFFFRNFCNSVAS